MKTVAAVPDLRRARGALHGRFGLVPTMGALHEGHLSLVRRARGECDHVGVSIFVNPTQFGAGEDLAGYPRDLERDLDLLAPLGVDLVWTPAAEAVYPAGFETWVDVERLSRPLEGACRPVHFRGVATVVAKLFNVFAPDRAYFGQKDAQQVAVIRRMAADLDFAVEAVVCPTVREPDGLALSSRNRYLDPEERRAATALYRALSAARAACARGERRGGCVRALMASTLAAEPLARPEYVSVADARTLEELETVDRRALLSLAVRIGRARLIDNVLFPDSEEECVDATDR